MNQQIADIALMMVLPLGITFTAILMAVSAETRTKIMMGVFLSFLIVAMDCIFFFAKNSFIAYNCDGGLLLSFASLFFFAIISFIRFDDRAARAANVFLAFFMLSAFMGIAYWDRPTFIPTSDYTAEEIAAMNMKYQDYIASFQNGEGGQIQSGSDPIYHHRIRTGAQAGKASKDDKDLNRLDNYLSEDGRVGVGIVCPKCNKETHGRYCVIRHTNGGWSWINAETNVMREWALANRKHGKRIMSHARVNRW